MKDLCIRKDDDYLSLNFNGAVESAFKVCYLECQGKGQQEIS